MFSVVCFVCFILLLRDCLASLSCVLCLACVLSCVFVIQRACLACLLVCLSCVLVLRALSRVLCPLLAMCSRVCVFSCVAVLALHASLVCERRHVSGSIALVPFFARFSCQWPIGCCSVLVFRTAPPDLPPSSRSIAQQQEEGVVVVAFAG